MMISPKTANEPKAEMFPPGVGTSLLPAPCTTEGEKLPTIAIISLGEMGLGIANLLSTYHYPLITNLTGRSTTTKARAAALNITDLDLPSMLARADILLSIVPPSEALTLAHSISAALPLNRQEKLVYLDLNALSPTLSKAISIPIISAGGLYIDGCILGFPPKLISENIEEGNDSQLWYRPALPLSGPPLPAYLSPLASLLRLEHISPTIGSASGLKMCFGSINKALTAVTIQSYSTASNLGILSPLRTYMGEYFPGLKSVGEASMLASQYKAYRWVKEMEEVGETFREEGGWELEGDVWKGVGGVFAVVSEMGLGGGKGRKGNVGEVAEEVCRAVKKRRGSV